VKSGIFSYSGRESADAVDVYVPGGYGRRTLDKGCISPHWCPKLRSSLIDCPAGLDSHGVFAEISGIDHEDSTTKAVAGHRCGAWPQTDNRKPASGREVI